MYLPDLIRNAVVLALVAGCYSETLLDAVQSLTPIKTGKPSILDIIGKLTSGNLESGKIRRPFSRRAVEC